MPDSGSTIRAQAAALICLDLDGTSVENDGLHVWFSDDVARALNEAARLGALWCSNSGRRAENQFALIQACRTLDVLPAAILSGERYIHHVHHSGTALLPWQPHCDSARAVALELAPRVRKVLDPHVGSIAARFGGIEYYPADEFVGWQLTTVDGAAELVALVRELLRPLPDAQVLRNGAWVIVAHAGFGKGRVLSDAAAGMDIPRERILAVGDQPNDLDMLDGRAAGFVGCPADADDEVKSTVTRAGGWISDAPGCTGTVRIIARFLEKLKR